MHLIHGHPQISLPQSVPFAVQSLSFTHCWGRPTGAPASPVLESPEAPVASDPLRPPPEVAELTTPSGVPELSPALLTLPPQPAAEIASAAIATIRNIALPWWLCLMACFGATGIVSGVRSEGP
jgi:hypothetical protein